MYSFQKRPSTLPVLSPFRAVCLLITFFLFVVLLFAAVYFPSQTPVSTSIPSSFQNRTSADLHRHFECSSFFFFLDDCAKLEWNKWNTATVKSFTERGGECAVVAALHSHLLDLPFHYDAVVDTTDLINPLLMHAVEIHLKFSAFDSSVRRSGPPPCSIQGPTSKPVSCKHAQNGIQTQDNSADRNHHPALIEQDATFLGLCTTLTVFLLFF